MSLSVPSAGRISAISNEISPSKRIDCLRKFPENELPFIGDARNSVSLKPELQLGSWSGVQCVHNSDNPSPHLTGTHVECIRHVIGDAEELSSILQSNAHYLEPMEGVHVILEPEELPIVDTLKEKVQFWGDDTYSIPLNLAVGCIEKVITQENLVNALLQHRIHPGMVVALQFKGGENGIKDWPYLTNEAVEYLLECKFSIVILNVPSMDRENDGGRTSNHKILFENPHSLIIESADLSRLNRGGNIKVTFDIDHHQMLADCASCTKLEIQYA